MAKTKETKKSGKQQQSSQPKQRLMVKEIARTTCSKREANICGRSHEVICGRSREVICGRA